MHSIAAKTIHDLSYSYPTWNTSNMGRKDDHPKLKASGVYAANTTGNGKRLPLLPWPHKADFLSIWTDTVS